MQNNGLLEFSFVKSIDEIPRQEWNRLFGDSLIEGYGFQKTLEESHLQGFSFGHLLARREEKLVAIWPFFVMDFSFALLLPHPINKPFIFLQRYFKRFLKMRVLFFGSLTAEEFYLGVEKEENLDEILGWSIKEVSSFCKKEKISGFAFNNVSEKNQRLAQALQKTGLTCLEGLPTTRVEINTKSLDDYINSLSKNMRKDLKRKLKRSAELTSLKTEIFDDISDISQQIYKLYLNNFSEAELYFEILTPDFFLGIIRNMPETAKFFITRAEEEIVAFNLLFIKGDTCIDKFIGFDSNVAHKYHLYYTTFCHNIDWCIKNGVSYYYPGVTDYYPKVRLGAQLIPLDIYAQAINPLLNLFIKKAGRFIAPKNLDPSLKEFL